jgi:hypothetical protein
MSAPTYLIAKYAPDVARMEPRNIGVILWASMGVECKFMPSADAHFVSDVSMYDRWTRFWADACRKPELETKNGIIKRRDVAFLKALRETQAGNFFLYEGGFIADNVPAVERENATDFLYRTLVATPGSLDVEAPAVRDSLEARCDALFEEAGFLGRDEFIPEYALEIDAEGVKVPFKFDYAWENGSLGALFLRVHLTVQPSTTNAAYLFEHAKVSARKAERYALISHGNMAGDHSEREERIKTREKVLSKYCAVLNVDDAASVKHVLGGLL